MRAQLSTVDLDHNDRIIHSEMHDPQFDHVLFLRSLSETIAWCKPRASLNDPENCLRSTELFPDGWPPESFALPIHQAKPTIDKRHLLLNHGSSNTDTRIDLEGGKLLVFFPENCLYEGAVAGETHSFIGPSLEEPPWDTWVYYGIADTDIFPSVTQQEYLISWIPPQFVDLVNGGLRVMTLEWLWWIDPIDFTS